MTQLYPIQFRSHLNVLDDPDQADTDHDCIGDVCDPLPNEYDPSVPDSDGDGIGNKCDECPYDLNNDIDNDGICGNIDNCPNKPNGPDLGTCVNTSTGAIGSTCMNNGACNTGEYCTLNQEDSDHDGIGDACGLLDSDSDDIPDVADNCPNMPNSSVLGTCVKVVGGVIVGLDVSCTADSDCLGINGLCQKYQGDSNGNGVGDVCECYADINCDTKVNLTDLIIMKMQYNRFNCPACP